MKEQEQELGSHWPRVGQREYPSGITLVLVSTWQQYPSGTLVLVSSRSILAASHWSPLGSAARILLAAAATDHCSKELLPPGQRERAI